MTKYSVFSLKAEAAILKHTTIFNWIFLLLHCFTPLNETPGFNEVTKKCCYHKFVSAQALTQDQQSNLEFRSEYRLQ